MHSLLLFLATITPFTIFIHPHLVNGTLFLLAGLCMFVLAREGHCRLFGWTDRVMPLDVLVIFYFIAPILAVFVGQIFRQEFLWPYYDSPARLLLCLPIFIVLSNLKVDSLKYMSASIPFAVLLGVLLNHLGYTVRYGVDRVTLASMDPLAFGSLSLTYAFLCLVAVGTLIPFRSVKAALCFVGFFAGIYLSIISGSRTGWLAVLPVLILWVNVLLGSVRKAIVMCLIVVMPTALLAYRLIPVVQMRVDQAVLDLASYQWNGLNAQTSVGDRISFLRVGLSLFAERPLSGWGDHSFAPVVLDADRYRFASVETRQWLVNCGFHNELMTSLVRSGLWGGIAHLMLFIVPGTLFIRATATADCKCRDYGIWGLSYLLFLVISSMSNEVFNLKYLASFHGLMLTFLMSSVIRCMKSSQQKQMVG